MAWLASLMPGLQPSPVSHVHLVEGLLSQQGLHQGPGHGGVICVVQCFCRKKVVGVGESNPQGYCSMLTPLGPYS